MGILDKFFKPYRDRVLNDALESGEFIQTAQKLGVLAPQSPAPRSMFYDVMSLVSQTQYKDRYVGLSYDILKSMADRTEVVNTILNTRLAQIGAFCQPARWKNKTGLGFQIRFKDAKKEPNKEEAKYLADLEEMFYHCGYTDIYRSGERRPDFQEFVKAILRDSLVYDQMCFEIIPARNGKPCEWWAVDASTIRHALPPKGDLSGYTDGRDIVKYVQIYNGAIRHSYTYKEMAFCIRNNSTDMKRNGYGFAELEQVINLITAVLWAEEYNKRFFSQGQMINGLLNLKGSNIAPDMLEAFRRQWHTLVSSVTNAHKIPVLTVKDGVEFVNLHSSNRDMEFTAWMEYLIKMVTGAYLIDPAEVGFDYRGSSESAPLFESSPEAKLKHSRDKGLRNLLDFIEKKINFHILHEIDSNLFFEFVGIDMKDEQELVNIRASEVQAYKSLNEVRKEANLEPIKHPVADWPLNSVAINFVLTQMQLDQQTQMAQQQPGEQPESPQGDPSEAITHADGMEPDQKHVPVPAKPGKSAKPQPGGKA